MYKPAPRSGGQIARLSAGLKGKDSKHEFALACTIGVQTRTSQPPNFMPVSYLQIGCIAGALLKKLGVVTRIVLVDLRDSTEACQSCST